MFGLPFEKFLFLYQSSPLSFQKYIAVVLTVPKAVETMLFIWGVCTDTFSYFKFVFTGV